MVVHRVPGHDPRRQLDRVIPAPPEPRVVCRTGQRVHGTGHRRSSLNGLPLRDSAGYRAPCRFRQDRFGAIRASRATVRGGNRRETGRLYRKWPGPIVIRMPRGTGRNGEDQVGSASDSRDQFVHGGNPLGGKGFDGPFGFGGREFPGVLIRLCERRDRMVPQRAALQQEAKLTTLRQDRPSPGTGPRLGLVFPLEEVSKQGHQSAGNLAPIAPSHVGEVLAEVFAVQLVNPVLGGQSSHRLQPGRLVLMIERRQRDDRSVSHDAASHSQITARPGAMDGLPVDALAIVPAANASRHRRRSRINLPSPARPSFPRIKVGAGLSGSRVDSVPCASWPGRGSTRGRRGSIPRGSGQARDPRRRSSANFAPGGAEALVRPVVDRPRHRRGGQLAGLHATGGSDRAETGTPTSKSKMSGTILRWYEKTGPVRSMPWAATVAITSAMAGPMTCWISARGIVSRMTAVCWASVWTIWGSSIKAASSLRPGVRVRHEPSSRRRPSGGPPLDGGIMPHRRAVEQQSRREDRASRRPCGWIPYRVRPAARPQPCRPPC